MFFNEVWGPSMSPQNHWILLSILAYCSSTVTSIFSLTLCSPSLFWNVPLFELQLMLQSFQLHLSSCKVQVFTTFISDVLLWIPTYGRAKAEKPARTYIHQLCEDTGCSPEDLPEAMNDREKWRERVKHILASGTTWWCWYLSQWYSSKSECKNVRGVWTC